MRKSWLFLFLTSVVCVVSLYVALKTTVFNQSEEPKAQQKGMPVLEEMFSLIKEKSVYAPTDQQLMEGALRGMAAAIKDPYSTYYSSEEAKQHKAALSGEKVGIGIELSMQHGRFVVVSPVKGSPAERVGIRPLDELVQVGEVRLEGKTMSDVLKLMQGNKGEKVSLVLFRPSLNKHLQVEVERAEMKNETVTARMVEVEEEKIGVVTIRLFGEETLQEWVTALAQLETQHMDALIVDVRDNPGGYLHSVAGILSVLQRQGVTFAFMENGASQQEALKTANIKEVEQLAGKVRALPIAIIQNGGSASASEVFSAAMQSWGAATIIGETSFGKGTVQESWDLKNGGQVKLSTNKWLTPKKEWIHQKGIKPDMEIEQHPLFLLENMPLKGRFEVGDFAEEVAYTQRALHGLGYHIVRTDGFYDEVTKDAVVQFREEHDLAENDELDEAFFAQLQQKVDAFKADDVNDMQLQMAISFLMHNLGN